MKQYFPHVHWFQRHGFGSDKMTMVSCSVLGDMGNLKGAHD